MFDNMQSIDNKIINRIYGKGRGWCFTPKSFFDLGSPEAIRVTLFRLAKKGTIRCLSRGLYDYPKKHSKIGLLAPDPNAVARALSRRDATRLQPSGAYAANLLGLSEQVPAKIVFLTDGPTRHVKIGRQEIVLKNTIPRNMATAGKVSGTVIQALRYIGKKQVSMAHIANLTKTLTDEDKRHLWRDKVYAPGWMHPFIDQIVRTIND
jgi:predicted transcriptional regulator of viral defense system